MKTGARPLGFRIIGVDVATQAKNVGLAFAHRQDDVLHFEDVTTLATWPAIDAQARDWLQEPTLLAIDAPLGWPHPLARALRDHHAGDPLPSTPNEVFRRRTDDVVAQTLGKRPLDVGADRIARTAHAALGLLFRLRETTGLPIPLAWEPGRLSRTSAIEVYPAGTLASRGVRSSGYKGAGTDARDARRAIIDAMRGAHVMSPGAVERATASDHVLDAMLCCLAADDFLQANVIEPNDHGLARREGWIWVAPPG